MTVITLQPNTIYGGYDALDFARLLPDDSLHGCISSPPYFGLRDYGTGQWKGGDPNCQHMVGNQIADNKAPGAITSGVRPGVDAYTCRKCGAKRIDRQIGLEASVPEYVEALRAIFHEVYRAMRSDGLLWINLGDSYANDDKWGGSTGGKHRADLHGTSTARARRQTGLKAKDLIGIPWRVAFALQDDGWILRNDIIWQKINAMPESVGDRLTKAHEYVFLFAKSNEAQFWTHSGGKPGTRQQPAPEYEWKNRDTGDVTSIEPTDWRDLTASDGKRLWARRNRWEAHDYYFDQDAIREPYDMESVLRSLRGMNENKWSNGAPGSSRHSLSKPRANVNKMAGTEYGGDGTGFRGHSGYIGANGQLLLNPAGRNKRTVWEVPPTTLAIADAKPLAYRSSVWTINTTGFKGAHFATFPFKLIEPMILSGVPETVCAACGAPYTRVVERKPMVIRRSDRAAKMGRFGRTQASGTMIELPEARTIGWQPTCECHAGTEAGIVFDPFMGAGTTAVAAIRLNRRFIGCDLNDQYVREIALPRIREEQRLKAHPRMKKSKKPTVKTKENRHSGDYSLAPATLPMFAEDEEV